MPYDYIPGSIQATPGSIADSWQDEKYGKQNLDVFAQGIRQGAMDDSQKHYKSVYDRLLDDGRSYREPIEFEKAWRTHLRQQLVEKGGQPGTQEFEQAVEEFAPKAREFQAMFVKPRRIIPANKNQALIDADTGEEIYTPPNEKDPQDVKDERGMRLANQAGGDKFMEYVRMYPDASREQIQGAVGDTQRAIEEELTSVGRAQKSARDDAFKMKMEQERLDLAKNKPARPLARATSPQALRKEINADATVKTYRDVRNAYQRVEAAMEEAKTSKSFNAVDQALINTFNRMLEPGSVTRESEYARTPEGIALINRVEGGLEKLVKGGSGLTGVDRAGLADMAKRLMDATESNYEETINFYTQVAEESGIKPSLVIQPIKRSSGHATEVAQAIPTITTKAEHAALPSGAQYIGSDGQVYTKK